jgi:hypothetical protein
MVQETFITFCPARASEALRAELASLRGDDDAL